MCLRVSVSFYSRFHMHDFLRARNGECACKCALERNPLYSIAYTYYFEARTQTRTNNSAKTKSEETTTESVARSSELQFIVCSFSVPNFPFHKLLTASFLSVSQLRFFFCSVWHSIKLQKLLFDAASIQFNRQCVFVLSRT